MKFDAQGQVDPLLALRWNLSGLRSKTTICPLAALPECRLRPGIILQAIGFRTPMFTVLFAVARTVGWSPSGKKMIDPPNASSGVRASSIPVRRAPPFVPIAKRKGLVQSWIRKGRG